MDLPTSPHNIELFGQFGGDFPEENRCINIEFPASLVSKHRFWPNSSLSAKFIADYVSVFLPPQGSREKQIRHRAEVADAVRYITNELLENAFKFSCTESNQPVLLIPYCWHNRLVITVTNTSHISTIDGFKEIIHDLTTIDPMELYVRRSEENLSTEHSLTSGLGLITILTNYDAQLGWKIEHQLPDVDCFTVTTMVQLLYELEM